jgi:hypothetical protein
MAVTYSTICTYRRVEAGTIAISIQEMKTSGFNLSADAMWCRKIILRINNNVSQIQGGVDAAERKLRHAL